MVRLYLLILLQTITEAIIERVSTFLLGLAVLINAITIPIHPNTLDKPNIIYLTEGSSAVTLAIFPNCPIQIICAPFITVSPKATLPPTEVNKNGM